MVSADPSLAEELRGEGLLEAPRPLATNTLAILVPKGNPKDIRGIDDLRRPGIRFVMADAGVPLGDYAARAAGRARRVGPGRDGRELRERRRGERGEGGPGRGRRRDRLHDRRGRGETSTRSALPADAQPRIVYTISVVAGSDHAGEAEEFVDDGPRRRWPGAPGRWGLRAAVRRGAFTALLVSALALALFFLALPLVAIFAEAGPAGDRPPARQRLRARRDAGEPQDQPDRPGDHPRGGHAGRLPARHAALPRAIAGAHADRAAAGAAAGGGGHRPAGGLRQDRACWAASLERARDPAAVHPDRRGARGRPSSPAPSTCARPSPRSRPSTPTCSPPPAPSGRGPARAFARVALPLALGGLGAGAALAFARGLGEFGATIIFAGSFPGRTQTAAAGDLRRVRPRLRRRAGHRRPSWSR